MADLTRAMRAAKAALGARKSLRSGALNGSPTRSRTLAASRVAVLVARHPPESRESGFGAMSRSRQPLALAYAHEPG
jgi:hypothetical protein